MLHDVQCVLKAVHDLVNISTACLKASMELRLHRTSPNLHQSHVIKYEVVQFLPAVLHGAARCDLAMYEVAL